MMGAVRWLSRVVFAASLLSAPPASLARSQTSWDPNAIPYAGASNWQQAAVAALNRHLPPDSGYFVLGPLDITADPPDTLRLIQTTIRILTPDQRAFRNVTRRLRVPPGGVALEELSPADTLAGVPPGYPGRFLKGTIVGERTYVQILTVQQHRWLLWAERTLLTESGAGTGGSLRRYSQAVRGYLAALDGSRGAPRVPTARSYNLDLAFDIFAAPPAAVVRDREGFLRLLAENRGFNIGDAVQDVYGFVPGMALSDWLQEQADGVLFRNKEGEAALQHRYRDFVESGGRWLDLTLLTANSLARLLPGRYVYAVDRYGFIHVGRVESGPGSTSLGPTERDRSRPFHPTAALLMHSDPVRAAGELLLVPFPGGLLRVAELNIRSEEYFFSNRSLTLYLDVQERSDRYMLAVGHVLKALDMARIPREGVLISKY